MTQNESFGQFLKKSILQDVKDNSNAGVLLYLCFCIFLNYYFNIENTLFSTYSSKPIGVAVYFLFYAVAYFPVMFWLLYRSQKLFLLKNKYFFWLSAGVILSLSLSATYFYLTPLLKSMPDDKTEYLIRKLLVNGRNIVFVAIPALFIWKYVKEKDDNFFWFSFRRIKLKTYFSWLFLMIIVIAFVSLSTSFQQVYPSFKPNMTKNVLNIHHHVWFGIYELIYGFDFIWVEFLFRGILVLGLYRIVGKEVLMPMVSLYCFIHFGKPIVESISSIVGGYFLGILSLYTRSIAGGSILHIGIAYAMDFFALLWILLPVFK